MPKNISSLLIILFIALTGFKTTLDDEPVNYYGIPENISFNKTDFTLSWSSHPNDNYYKQEYLPKGDIAEHFHDMVLIDFIITDLSAKDAAGAQIVTINERKKTDAVCNYEVFKNPDGKEYILNFIMSERNGDKVNLVEWSAYHYKPYTDKAGHKGVQLFGISHRAYGDDVMPFLKSLKNYKNEQVNKLVAYPVPEIQLK
jgi:hypothetical protein